jgi:tetratricopeptide (TPR) repeat protein
VAQSYYQLGTAEDSGTSSASAGQAAGTSASRRYFTRARDLYQQLLVGTDAPPNDTALSAARFQLGECYRELGQFQEALDSFSAVLSERESSLPVQRAGAYAYQQRGQAEGIEWLERAISGGYKLRSTGENRIWGWLKLSQIAERAARSDAKYADAFFDARLNLARCRYLIAVRRGGAAAAADLAQAKHSIQSVVRLYPELGGPQRRAQFDALLKEIQSSAGEPQIGLQEFSDNGA